VKFSKICNRAPNCSVSKSTQPSVLFHLFPYTCTLSFVYFCLFIYALSFMCTHVWASIYELFIVCRQFHAIYMLLATLFDQAFWMFQLHKFKEKRILLIKFLILSMECVGFVRNRAFVEAVLRNWKIFCKPFVE